MVALDDSEFKRGAVSAIITISLCHPIHKVSLRQALMGVSVLNSLNSIRREGIFALYRGIGPPLLQKTIGISMMYGAFETNRKLFKSLFPDLNNTLISMMAGIVAGVLETVLTPFERIQILLTCPSHSLAIKDTLSAFKYIYHVYPLNEFIRGWQPVLLKNILSTCLFFGVRDSVRSLFPKNNRYENLKNFITGAFLGAVISTICFPINSSKIFMQGQLGAPYLSYRKSISKLYDSRNRNFRKLYIGSGVNAFRSLMGWGIMNTVHEYLVNHRYFVKS